jgi:hypothetical protein
MSPHIRTWSAVGGYGIVVTLLAVAVWLKTAPPEPPPEPTAVQVVDVGAVSRPSEYPGPGDSPPAVRALGRVNYDMGSSVPYYKLDLPLPEIPVVDLPPP